MLNYKRVPISEAGTTSDRKGIIGGSQVGAVLGLDGYVTQYDVYLAFNGHERPVSPMTEETFGFGHILEDSIAKMFSFKTGMETEEVPYVYVAPQNEKLLIHVDREIISTDGKRRALECKTVSSFAAKKWADYDNLSEPYIISELIPAQYLAQVYWYYALGDYDEVYISRLTNNKLWTYLIPKPDRQVLDDVIEEVDEFYKKLMTGWVPPMTFRDRKGVKVAEGADKNSITADDKMIKLYEEMLEIKAQEKELDERKGELQDDLTAFIGENSYLILPDGRKIASYLTQNRTSIDSTRLKKDHPDIWQEYGRPSSCRIFKLLK